MKEMDVKELLAKVDNISIDQRAVERKTFENYLLDKQEKGQYKNTIITFDDSDDYAFFENLCSNLGIDVTDFIK